MQKIDGREIRIKLTHKDIAELDRLAGRIFIGEDDAIEGRNQLIRNLIDVGLDILHGYEAVGIIRMVEIKRRLGKNIKEDTIPSLF